MNIASDHLLLWTAGVAGSKLRIPDQRQSSQRTSRTKRGAVLRDLYRKETTSDRWPWLLYLREREEIVREWSLLKSAGDRTKIARLTRACSVRLASVILLW